MLLVPFVEGAHQLVMINSSHKSYIGRHRSNILDVSLNDTDTQPLVCKFYGALNNILRVTGPNRNEMVTVHLVKTYCLPSLLYGCETWYACSEDIRSANVDWNNSFRKNFNSFWRESVKPLLIYCWCLPVPVLIHQRRLLFWKNAYLQRNVC